MTSALADDWRDVPPPVVSHKHDAYERKLMPWDTAPQPRPAVAPVRPTRGPRPGVAEVFADGLVHATRDVARALGVAPDAAVHRMQRSGLVERVAQGRWRLRGAR